MLILPQTVRNHHHFHCQPDHIKSLERFTIILGRLPGQALRRQFHQVSTVDLSLYSPKIASYFNINLEIAFADLTNTLHDQAYFIIASPGYSYIVFDFATAMYITQFSNISRYIVSYIPATITQRYRFIL